MEEYSVEKNFKHHVPGEEDLAKYTLLRADFRAVVERLLKTCPKSRERSLALTKLEEASFWANASIARNH